MQDVEYLFQNKILRQITSTFTEIGGRKDVIVLGDIIKRRHGGTLKALSNVDLNRM